MNSRTKNLIAELRQHSTEDVTSGSRNLTKQAPLIAEIIALIADEQAKSAKRLELLTVWLIILTLILTAFTAYLCVEAYQTDQDGRQSVPVPPDRIELIYL